MVHTDTGDFSRLIASSSSVAATVAPSVRIVPATAVARALPGSISVSDPWPWSGDTPAEKARRVARSYRDRLDSLTPMRAPASIGR